MMGVLIMFFARARGLFLQKLQDWRLGANYVLCYSQGSLFIEAARLEIEAKDWTFEVKVCQALKNVLASSLKVMLDNGFQ